jgi:hypothetical protein
MPDLRFCVDYGSERCVRSWDGDALSIKAWLQGLGLGRYEQAFRANEIDADLLSSPTEQDLREIGVADMKVRRGSKAALKRSGADQFSFSFAICSRM